MKDITQIVIVSGLVVMTTLFFYSLGRTDALDQTIEYFKPDPSNVIIVTTDENKSYDFDHEPQTIPKLFYHSMTNPDIKTDEFVEIYRDPETTDDDIIIKSKYPIVCDDQHKCVVTWPSETKVLDLHKICDGSCEIRHDK